ncbi:putative NUDIX hydrolase [Octadecabacter antarcticus 307]|uniref:Putative NUDIX hydrolase n=1 Tax=Octadecabacter antarcticus 307 TaxID=391626 RepID=M9R9Z9_9RHOB|nr:NUDIX hydrolase [Octadecabacter antarcticus]AGI66575.1 putative NUDIX hydrolase [Octadecabacter antarcticus 307]
MITRPIRHPSIRLAARAILLHDDHLLLVNAYKGRSDLWCAPGGGAEPHQSLPENLAREVFEETGLRVSVGAPCLVNEFHDPNGTFHQVEVFFRCTLIAGELDPAWQDPEKIVTQRRWVTRDELAVLTVRPKSLAGVAWGDAGALVYDPLEAILP